MSPIIDLQRRLVEVGRIRMGATAPTQRGGTRPIRLDNWRLTSRDQQRLQAAADVYGGTVTPWEGHDGQYVLDTQTDALRIMLMPGQTLTQHYELWSGGGCQRRCDGQREILSDGPCLCPDQYDERNELAKDGKACKPTTRLSVLLPDVPGIGCWRLETHGFYAAVELAGTAALLEEATRRGSLLPARLRIDQRRQVRDGKTTTFPVPVVDIDIRLPEMLAITNGGAATVELERPVYKPLAAGPGVSVSAGIAAVGDAQPERAPRANAAAPIGPTADEFNDAPIPVPVDTPGQVEPEEKVVNDRQVKLLWTTIRSRGVPEDEVRRIVVEVTGQESTKAIPASLFDAVLTAVQAVEVAQPVSPFQPPAGVGA